MFGAPYSSPQCIECIQGGFPRLEIARSKKLPGRSDDCGKRAKRHRRQKDGVAPLVQESQLIAIVEFCGARMNGKIGASVSIRRLELSEDRGFCQDVSASAGNGLSESGNHIVVQTLLANQVERNLQRGHIIFRNGRRSAQRALRNVEALVSTLLLGNCPRVLDRDQDRRSLRILRE